MRYRLQLVPSAAQALRNLDHRTRLPVQRNIDSLADNPRPPGVKLLSLEQPIYRLKAGDFRIRYHVDDAVQTVLVIAIGESARSLQTTPIGS